MRAPSKAKAIKLDNPAQAKPNQQPETELHILGGNEQYEAVARAVYQPQCASVKVLSPVIFHVTPDQSFHMLEVRINISEMKRVFQVLARPKLKGKHMLEVSGSKSVAGRRIECFGTWESLTISECCSQSPKRVREQFCKAVGLVDSRGVNRVMPIEVKGTTRSGQQFNVRRKD